MTLPVYGFLIKVSCQSSGQLVQRVLKSTFFTTDDVEDVIWIESHRLDLCEVIVWVHKDEIIAP